MRKKERIKTTAVSLCKIFWFIGFLLLPGVSHSQSFPQNTEKRVALVIGNADYLHGPLTNPVNDARSMYRALRNVGFEVILKENVSNKDEMKKVIRDFGWELRKGGVGLFYYAGHGMQVDGFNFLVPVNAVINSESEVEYECVDAGFVLAQMEAAQNRLNIVILDACRNNPFARSFRSTQQGLVSMNAPTGTLIAYATAPGKVASDGTGFNGLYTEALLNQIKQPDLKIEETFKNVRAEVLQKSGGNQTPWESSSLVGDFYFKPENVILAYNNQLREQVRMQEQYEEDPIPNPPLSDNINNVITAEWKATSEGYWFEINGIDVTDYTTFELLRGSDDLIVTYNEMQFRLPGFKLKKNRDDTFRPAELITPQVSQPSFQPHVPNNTKPYDGTNPLDQISLVNLPNRYKPDIKIRAIFRVTMDYEYSLILDGIDISLSCVEKVLGDDLYVYYPSRDLMFLLEGFSWSNDYRTRTATLVRFNK